MKTLSLLLLALAVLMNAVRADIAYYTGSVTYQREGNAEHKTFACNEVFLVDLDTYTVIEIFIFPAVKRYIETVNTYEHAIVPIGAAAKTVTILQYADDNAGIPELSTGIATGKNSQLAVTNARIIATPRVFKYNSSVFFPGQELSYSQVSGLLTFNAKKTLATNAQGLSVYDAPTAVIDELTAKGYQRLPP